MKLTPLVFDIQTGSGNITIGIPGQADFAYTRHVWTDYTLLCSPP